LKLKWKAILSIMSIILLIWAGLVGFIYEQGKEDLNLAIETRIASARDIATTMEKGLYPSYQKRIRSLVSTEASPARKKMVQAFYHRNREDLLKFSEPFYKVLQKESPELRSFAWILPDNTAFLRLHFQDLKGDNVAKMRPDIVAVNRQKRQIAAYATSGLGLGYHVSQPVFWQGEYCGAVQFGIDISQLVSLLKLSLNSPIGILIPSEKGQFIKQKYKQLPSLKVGEYLVLSANPTDFRIDNPELDWQAERSWFTEQNKHYAMIRLLPLLDFNKKPVGYIVSKLDLSDEYFAIMARFWAVIGTSSLLLILLFFLLYSSFNLLLKKIFQLNSSLEKQNSTLEQRVEERSAELKKSKDEWVAMFNAIPDMVSIQNRDLVIIEANKAICDFFGLSANEIIGKHCYELFYNRSESCPSCTKNKSFQTFSNYTTTINNEELQRTFQITAAPIYIQDKNSESFVHIIQDITDKKQLEEDLLQAQKMEAIGTLAGGIAHDFNNILSAIIGYATLAQMREPEESRLSNDLGNIIKAGNRAADLVKQILTFSRKDASCEELFQPHLLLKEVLKMLRSSIPSTIDMVTDIDPHSGWINASQVRMHQVIMNLCTNAVQSMKEEKGTLNIQLMSRQVTADEISEAEIKPGTFICLSVVDTGNGMDSRTMERIFDPYFTTKIREQGTGLGLAVVHVIIHELKGFIRVSSEIGKGSRFDIYLPSAEIQETIPLQMDDKFELPTGTERLLVIDDEPPIIEITRDMLSELGYQVETESNSVAALGKIRQQPNRYDLVISDQTMPELTGLDLAEELQRLNPKVPVIICTGYSSIINGQTNLSPNIKKLMAKPLPLPELASAVRQALADVDGICR